MKKLLSAMLVLVMLLSLAACGSSPLKTCKDLLGNAVNLDHYDEPKVDGDNVSIYHSGTPVSKLDYTVKMASLTVTMPATTYKELLAAGWSSNMPDTAEAQHIYTNSCTGTGAGTVTITILNPTEADMAIKDTVVTGISVTKGFEIAGITEASSVADVMGVFGEPSIIHYSDTLGLSLEFKDDLGGSLEFTFDSNGNITEVNYSYNDQNLI